MHPRNIHLLRYDFDKLKSAHPELIDHVIVNDYGDDSINFFDPKAVMALNIALLKAYYNVKFYEIPDGYLCPPVPGRADYIHTLAELLEKNGVEHSEKIRILDIGTGANGIYPILGNHCYNWTFTGSEIEDEAIKNLNKLIEKNPHLKDRVQIRKQTDSGSIFKNIIQDGEYYHATMSNPPFHSSAEEAAKGTTRKNKGILGKKGNKQEKFDLNFGGQSNELWCEGGEIIFIKNMITESLSFKNQVGWFTTLVSKESNLPAILKFIIQLNVKSHQIIEMTQGNKKSRILIWSFNK